MLSKKYAEYILKITFICAGATSGAIYGYFGMSSKDWGILWGLLMLCYALARLLIIDNVLK